MVERQMNSEQKDKRIADLEEVVEASVLALKGACNLFRALPQDAFGTNANGFIRDEVIAAIQKIIVINESTTA